MIFYIFLKSPDFFQPWLSVQTLFVQHQSTELLLQVISDVNLRYSVSEVRE